MTFTASTYTNMVAERTKAQENLFLTYIGERTDFDIIIVGSGMGGGVLADAVVHKAPWKRILVIEAGSFLYPTHVYNMCGFSNADLARHFACTTFTQPGDEHTAKFIGEKPQLNFGGRSIFWSGLIPTLSDWELAFFPDQVRQSLESSPYSLEAAGPMMNQSVSMGETARAVVEALRATDLAEDFEIQETPRAIHQPYLASSGAATAELFLEPTGVFNTAELLVNELGLTPGNWHGEQNGLFLLLNNFVEDVGHDSGSFHILSRDTITGEPRYFNAGCVVLAGGSLESPKLLRRSTLFRSLPQSAQSLVGRGLTDHPTTDWLRASATEIGGVRLTRQHHAKIVFYSRGRPGNNGIKYPFNVEMNINHEWWHQRQNDAKTPLPNDIATDPSGPAVVEVKFSFGNPLDEENEIRDADPFGYVPQIVFRNQKWVDGLAESRFPALAGWKMDAPAIFQELNAVAERIFAAFRFGGSPAAVTGGKVLGTSQLGFGWGTVHHAVGSLRMPYKPAYNHSFAPSSVVSTDLEVIGATGLYVCDMSVLPFSPAANPVRPLVALAQRLAERLSH